MKFKEVVEIATDIGTFKSGISTGEYYINMQEKVFFVPYFEIMASGQKNSKGESYSVSLKYYTFDNKDFKEVNILPLKSAISNGWFIYNNRTLPLDLLYIRNAY